MNMQTNPDASAEDGGAGMSPTGTPAPAPVPPDYEAARQRGIIIARPPVDLTPKEQNAPYRCPDCGARMPCTGEAHAHLETGEPCVEPVRGSPEDEREKEDAPKRKRWRQKASI
jgi:hypothetical protein